MIQYKNLAISLRKAVDDRANLRGYARYMRNLSIWKLAWDAAEVIETLLGEHRPQIVCLCGSTRFYKTFDEQNFQLTLEGKIILSIGCNTKSDEGLELTAEDKVRLDELHKRKIDLCDSVLVLNVGGYIGDSTRSEIEYAELIGKPVGYLEA